MIAPAAAAALWLDAAPPRAPASLPVRVRRVVVHVLGGPSYPDPSRRFRFFSPPETQAMWKPRFGAHWIIWTDGTLWPRRPVAGEPPWRDPAADRPASAAERARLAREAAPVYSHVYGANSQTLGVELAHSGRSSRAAWSDSG